MEQEKTSLRIDRQEITGDFGYLVLANVPRAGLPTLQKELAGLTLPLKKPLKKAVAGGAAKAKKASSSGNDGSPAKLARRGDDDDDDDEDEASAI